MWHKRKNAKAEFATIKEPALVGFRSAKRLHPFGVSFRSSFIYNQSPISEKRRFLHAQKPAAFVHHSSLVHVQVSVITALDTGIFIDCPVKPGNDMQPLYTNLSSFALAKLGGFASSIPILWHKPMANRAPGIPQRS